MTSLKFIVGSAFGALVWMFAATYLFVFCYSHFGHKGGDHAFYQRFAAETAPSFAIVIGIPTFLLLGMWSKQLGLAIQVWMAYVIIDICLLLATRTLDDVWVESVIAQGTRLCAIWIGTRLACA